MEHEGPLLESLTHRLAETPVDFLAEPRIGSKGRVQTAAVVGDLLRLLGGDPSPKQLAAFVSKSAPPAMADLPESAERNPPSFAQAGHERNRMAVTLILCWLLSDDWFRQTKLEADILLRLLETDAAELGAQSGSTRFVTDPDRREELARLTLARL